MAKPKANTATEPVVIADIVGIGLNLVPSPCLLLISKHHEAAFEAIALPSRFGCDSWDMRQLYLQKEA
jgi:hypothetical protein